MTSFTNTDVGSEERFINCGSQMQKKNPTAPFISFQSIRTSNAFDIDQFGPQLHSYLVDSDLNATRHMVNSDLRSI